MNRFSKILFSGLVGVGLVACDSDSPTDIDDQQQAADLVGAWTATEEDSHVVIVFFDDGTYVHVQDGPSDEAGQSGIEVGTYDWDPATGAFESTCPTTDTNGQWGLSNPEGDAGCTGVTAGLGVTVSVEDGSVEFDHGDGDVFTATRVEDVDGSIVGAWFTVEDDLEVLMVLLENGTYVHAEAGTADDAGEPGMERGTYTWDAANGAFTSTCPEADTNGQWGLSHPDPEAGCTGILAEMEVTVTVDGDTLQFGSVEQDSIVLTRVTAAP